MSRIPVPPPSEVHFPGWKKLELVGTFQPGAGAGSHPAVLLLPGSGPTDRDGNQGPALQTNVLKQIAENFAENGISTLRFDKRATFGYLSSVPKTAEGMNDFYSWEAFVGDAESAYKFMLTQPGADAGHGGILGHSEGGAITIAASETVHPKAIILVSTAGRDLGTVIEEQVARSYRDSGLPDDTQRKGNDDTARIVKAVRSTGVVPNDVPNQLKPIFPPYASRYLRSVFLFDPTRILAHLDMPCLIVQGERDIQISKDRDAPLLKAAAKHGDFILVKGASHCLKVLKNDQDPGFIGPIAPGVLPQISDWVKSHI